MKKEVWIIIVLAVLAVIFGILAYIGYNETKELDSQVIQLNADKEQLFNDKENALIENKKIRDELQLLNEDVAEIYKSCITQNACKGHFPGIRWYCNDVGDAVSDMTLASHLCECDNVCELKTTVVQTI